MTNLQKFAAQQLSKSQMNEVRGGETFYCIISINGAPPIKGPAAGASLEDVQNQLLALYTPMLEENEDRLYVKCSTHEWAL